MTRLVIALIVLVSCNCDNYYNKDEKIKSRLHDYKDAYTLISKNYELLKSNGLSFKSGSPELEGLTIDFKKIKRLTEDQDNQLLIQIKQLWDKKLIEPNGQIDYYLNNDRPSIHFRVKKCRRIEHIIYYGEDDLYDIRGESDDFSTFGRDSLDGHWRYVIQQVNSGQ